MKFLVQGSFDESFLKELGSFGKVVVNVVGIEKEIGDAEVLIVRSSTKVDKELLGKANKLKIVARAGIGLDNIDVNECKKRSIKVINTPDAVTNSVAELTVGMIISLLRSIHSFHASLKMGQWKKDTVAGNELKGKTIGLIGFGRTGRRVAQLVESFGVELIAYDPYVKELGSVRTVGLEELARESDIISIHAPLTDETRHMVDKKMISKMKGGVFIINTSRGQIIEEEALFEALKSGKIAGAALDVFNEEPYKGKLLELDNVLVTPHIAGSAKEAMERVNSELLKILKFHLNL